MAREAASVRNGWEVAVRSAGLRTQKHAYEAKCASEKDQGTKGNGAYKILSVSPAYAEGDQCNHSKYGADEVALPTDIWIDQVNTEEDARNGKRKVVC